jgi:hypothetical protein
MLLGIISLPKLLRSQAHVPTESHGVHGLARSDGCHPPCPLSVQGTHLPESGEGGPRPGGGEQKSRARAALAKSPSLPPRLPSAHVPLRALPAFARSTHHGFRSIFQHPYHALPCSGDVDASSSREPRFLGFSESIIVFSSRFMSEFGSPRWCRIGSFGVSVKN